MSKAIKLRVPFRHSGAIAFLILQFLPSLCGAQNSGNIPLSDADLLKIAGNKYASGELPLGDGHYVLDAPKKGYVYLCHKAGHDGGGAGRDGPWIHGTTWNIGEKLSVLGNVPWPDAQFSNTTSGNERMIAGNGLPVTHATGVFPIQPNDPVAAYDRNPNSIRAQVMQESLPLHPIYSDPPNCMGMEVGYMLTGVPLFNGFDAGLRDAAAHEAQDSCQGHPQVSGQYHYHSLTSCLRDASVKTVIGYALDGFPITGPMVTKGAYLTTDDLDICHGITSEVIEDGTKKITYHYVMTVDFPYSASCFRGKPVRTGPLHGPGSGQGGFSPIGAPQQKGGMPQPPAEAFRACEERSNGDACGFTSPRGDDIRGSCLSPRGNGLICVPMR